MQGEWGGIGPWRGRTREKYHGLCMRMLYTCMQIKTLILKKRERKTWYHCGNELGSRLLRAFYIEADSIFIFLLQLNIDYDFCLFGF